MPENDAIEKRSIRLRNKSVKRNVDISFLELVERFDKTRHVDFVGDDLGINSQRGEHYEFPNNTKEIEREVDKNKKDIKDLNIQPDDCFVDEKKGKKESWRKPNEYEFYGISQEDLVKLGEKARNKGRLIRLASIHGASHSVAMLCTLVNDGIPFDFAYYTNLDNEIEGEFEFVKYYTRYVLNVPLVIGRSQNTADEFFYNKGRWPSQRARWCTDLMKLDPLRGLFKKFFHDPMDAGQHVDIVQFLGMQAFQSPGRAKMSPDAKPSMLSVPKPYINVENTHCEVWESGQFKGKPKKINVANWPVDRKTGKFIGMEKWHEMSPDLKIMRVFDMLPIFYLDHEDDLDILENNGIIRNPSEIRWGRHGCVICPFANFRYYHEMHVNYPKIYKMCVKRRDLTSQKQLESGSLKAVWTQFGKNKFTEEMAKFGYHDDQGKFHHYTKDDPPF